MSISSTPAVVRSSSAPAASTMVVREVSGTHVVTIDGYSRTTRLSYGHCFSHAFTAAGHRWCLRYYPRGITAYEQKWISMYLKLDDQGCDDEDDDDAPAVKATFTISLLDSHSLAVRCTHVSKWAHTFTSGGEQRGFPKFVKRKVLEEGSIFECYLIEDRFRVRCNITVITETTVPPPARSSLVAAPPSSSDILKKDAKKEEKHAPERFVIVPLPDMYRHLGHLLSSEEGADVTLEVEGETFRAHRSILAARSPVFKAELFISTTEETTSTTTISSVSIKGIEPRVFKALLHFIYTDSLSEIDGEGETMTMVQHLLVAADQYGLERLKLMCEDKLCNHIGMASVGTILALAGKHGCDGLKKACLKFLMSGGNLKAAIATDGFDHLANSCPSILKELLAKVVL